MATKKHSTNLRYDTGKLKTAVRILAKKHGRSVNAEINEALTFWIINPAIENAKSIPITEQYAELYKK